MLNLVMMSEEARHMIEKAVELNKNILLCSLDEPYDIINCLKEKNASVSPSYSAMRDMNFGEFDITPEDVLIDGIVVDKERAETTPCKCIDYNGKDLCWSDGIIGMLRQDQIAKYCPEKEFENKPKLIAHLNEFKKVAEETKGMPLLEKIEVMKKLLKSKSKSSAGETDEIGESLSADEVANYL